MIVKTESRTRTFNIVSKYRGKTVRTVEGGDHFEGNTYTGLTTSSQIMDDIHAANNIADPFEPSTIDLNYEIDGIDIASNYGTYEIDGVVQNVADTALSNIHANDPQFSDQTARNRANEFADGHNSSDDNNDGGGTSEGAGNAEGSVGDGYGGGD